MITKIIQISISLPYQYLKSFCCCINEEWRSQIKVANSVWLIFFQIQQKHYFLKNHIRYRNDSFCVVIRKQNAIFYRKNYLIQQIFYVKILEQLSFLTKNNGFYLTKSCNLHTAKMRQRKGVMFLESLFMIKILHIRL